MNKIVESSSKEHRELTLSNTDKLILMIPMINSAALAVLKKNLNNPAQINWTSNQACISNRKGMLVLAIAALAITMFHDFSSNELSFLGLFTVAVVVNTFYIESISCRDFIGDICRF